MTVQHESDEEAVAMNAGPRPEPSLIDAPTPDAEAQFVAETTAHSRQTRIGWEVVVGAAVVVLVGAGIAYALFAGGAESGQPTQNAADGTPVEVQPLSEGNAASTSASQVVVTPSGPATSAESTRSRAIRQRAGQLAAAGQPLSELSGPPPQAVAMLVVPKDFTPATFGIVFQPYGWGPGGPEGGRLLVKINSSNPTNASAKALDKDFEGHNASLWCSPQDTKALAEGGTFTGVLTVVPQGDVGQLHVSDVKPAK